MIHLIVDSETFEVKDAANTLREAGNVADFLTHSTRHLHVIETINFETVAV